MRRIDTRGGAGVRQAPARTRLLRPRLAIPVTALLLVAAVLLAAAWVGLPATHPAAARADEPVVLEVDHNGTMAKQYTLTQLQALTAFPGYAGFKNDANNVTGPEAVTGVKITDVVQDALGAAMTPVQSLLMTAGDGYHMTFAYSQIANLSGFSLWDATTKDPVSLTGLTGPLATTLIYAAPDPPGDLLAAGPLRFMIVDGTSENVVMTGSDSIYNVTRLDVRDQTVKEWSLRLVGLKLRGVRQTRTIKRNDFQSCVNCHGSSYTASSHTWSGVPLYYLVGEVDGGKTMAYNATLARKGYRIRLTSTTGLQRYVSSHTIVHRRSIILAWQRDDDVLPHSLFPLRLTGPRLTPSQRLGRIKTITLLPK